MLVSVIVLFIITEFPQGVLALVQTLPFSQGNLVSDINLMFSSYILHYMRYTSNFLSSCTRSWLSTGFIDVYLWVVPRCSCTGQRHKTDLLLDALRASRRRHGHCGSGQQRGQLYPLLRHESPVQADIPWTVYRETLQCEKSARYVHRLRLVFKNTAVLSFLSSTYYYY